jgi:hypothetical protein
MACFQIAEVLVTWLRSFFAECILDHTFDFLSISKTGKRDLTQSFLNRLSGNVNFVWHSHLARKRSSGFIVGVRTNTMDLFACSDGEFYVKLHISNKSDNFTWCLVAIYGSTQDEFKPDFHREMVNLAKDNAYPIISLGRFHFAYIPIPEERRQV